jgi:hypothetical protein
LKPLVTIELVIMIKPAMLADRERGSIAKKLNRHHYGIYIARKDDHDGKEKTDKYCYLKQLVSRSLEEFKRWQSSLAAEPCQRSTLVARSLARLSAAIYLISADISPSWLGRMKGEALESWCSEATCILRHHRRGDRRVSGDNMHHLLV